MDKSYSSEINRKLIKDFFKKDNVQGVQKQEFVLLAKIDKHAPIIEQCSAWRH